MRPQTPEERARRAASFNEDAERYDRARPTYPNELFDHLWSTAELGPAPGVLEIGCGTGQASVSLAERGARLTCVEFGENMAAIARRKLAAFPDSKVIVSKFEEWDPVDRRFDVIFAAASWHWIPQVVRYEKAASVLRPGGSLAIVSSHHFYPSGFDPLFIPIQEVYGEVTGTQLEVKAQEMPDLGALDDRDRDHIAEMEQTGAFEDPTVTRVRWHFERGADEYIDLLATFSDHWALEPEQRALLFERIRRLIVDSPTGTITKHYLTTLRVARRR